MRVYTYFTPLSSIEAMDELALISLWADNWRQFGYEPVVLGSHEAQVNPLYREFRDKVLKFPTPNPPGYDEACWLRWLAFSLVPEEDLLVVDYDCFNYGFVLLKTEPWKINLFADYVPCMVMAKPKLLDEACHLMMDSSPGPEDNFHGIPVYEDQHWFRRAMKQFPATFNLLPTVKQYGEPGWEDAVVVHYANDATPAFRPRHHHIRKLRGW